MRCRVRESHGAQLVTGYAFAFVTTLFLLFLEYQEDH